MYEIRGVWDGFYRTDVSGYRSSTMPGCTKLTGPEQNTMVTLNQGPAEIRGVNDYE